jgi:hypothetical protein
MRWITGANRIPARPSMTSAQHSAYTLSNHFPAVVSDLLHRSHAGQQHRGLMRKRRANRNRRPGDSRRSLSPGSRASWRPRSRTCCRFASSRRGWARAHPPALEGLS